mgnify:CR=1 FL=1
MAAGIYSFTIEQGATTDFEVTYKDSTDTPVDLTGYKARMQIRPSIRSSEIYLTLSSSLGPCGTGLNLSGSNGITPLASGSIGIFISAISSSQLDFDSAKYDLEIASGSGNCAVVTRLLQGNVKLSKEVTQGSY